MAIEPDTKDWTWVLDRQCGECGFAAATHGREHLGGDIRENAAAWRGVLVQPDVAQRTNPDRWSRLEYGCHVRDALATFERRAVQMLSEDDPTFENWDQDETARAERYDEQDPAVVARELVEAADRLAATYDGVSGTQWERTGTRSNGTRFTVATLALYGLHDPIHHLWDVTQNT